MKIFYPKESRLSYLDAKNLYPFNKNTEWHQRELFKLLISSGFGKIMEIKSGEGKIQKNISIENEIILREGEKTN